MLPEFAAAEVLYNDDGSVKGVATGDKGIRKDGTPKDIHEPGYELHAKFTLFAEGCRGHLGKQLMAKFGLRENSGTQHYAIGIKELWDIDPAKHEPGRILHTLGWPLGRLAGTTGGSFLYHLDNNQVSLGLIVDLSYANPHLSPFDEMQRWKHHPLIAEQLEGGTRVSYGARAIVKGGLQALPKLTVPGAALVGDDAGFLNVLKVKGSHTAMKSGMLGAEAVFAALQRGEAGTEVDLQQRFEASWLHDELHSSRNAGPGLAQARHLLRLRLLLRRATHRRQDPMDAEGPDARPRHPQARQQGTANRLPQTGRQAVVRQALQRVPLQH